MRVLLIPVLLSMMAGAAFGIVICITMPSRIKEWPEMTWLSSAAFTCALVTDVLLTGMMIVCLRSSRTGIKSTETLLNTLIVYTINTGLLTSTLSLASLVFALVRPGDMIFIAVNMCTTHSYAVSVLALTNSRTHLRQIANATVTLEVSILEGVRRSEVRLSGAFLADKERDAEVRLN
ncbi:hypothetical protein C8Q76DRAFT_156951 [Earliella scabrosa]|nr:hypothetical protein C8Q76DRAFT_156951 [Earliella scabrosa]